MEALWITLIGIFRSLARIQRSECVVALDDNTHQQPIPKYITNN